jgi:hypothetical protein
MLRLIAGDGDDRSSNGRKKGLGTHVYCSESGVGRRRERDTDEGTGEVVGKLELV